MICPTCYATNTEDNIFCVNCGLRIKEVNTNGKNESAKNIRG